ncbi:MAG: hypothetical protein IIB67_08765 [Proteobacteria bacterium]|nr:hypothetical protein [Pseudomonadota bacterium]
MTPRPLLSSQQNFVTTEELRASLGTPGKVEKVKTYDLKPGMAEKYLTGQLHSPRRNATTRLIRIEGRNLKKVTRDAYQAVETV